MSSGRNKTKSSETSPDEPILFTPERRQQIVHRHGLLAISGRLAGLRVPQKMLAQLEAVCTRYTT